jgi:hypothetical protein
MSAAGRGCVKTLDAICESYVLNPRRLSQGSELAARGQKMANLSCCAALSFHTAAADSGRGQYPRGGQLRPVHPIKPIAHAIDLGQPADVEDVQPSGSMGSIDSQPGSRTPA